MLPVIYFRNKYTSVRVSWLKPLYQPLLFYILSKRVFPDGLGGSLPANKGATKTQLPSLGGEDPLEEGKATHSGMLAWRIPRTEEPGGLQSMGPQRVGHA